MTDDTPTTKRKHTVVTSWAPMAWNIYGKRFLETFSVNWPDEVKLIIVHEHGEDIPEEVRAHSDFERATWMPIEDVPKLVPFLEAIGFFSLARGQAGEQGYVINYDARMCRKPFIYRHVVESVGGKVFWLDADSMTHSPVPIEFLDQVLPDDAFCCFLGREHLKAEPGKAGPPTYTESGFLGFNADHDLCNIFFQALVDQIICTGALFRLQGWHDCWAFDAVRTEAEGQAPGAFRNLSDGLLGGASGHVFINSVLGKYMDHMKGDRKFAGRSSRSDLAVDRDEAYWGGGS